MTETHGLIVKTHWKTNAERLRKQMETSQQEADKQVGEKGMEPRDAFAIRAGIEAFVARAALDLLDEILQAAEQAENALPIPLTLGHHLILNGKHLTVINAEAQGDPEDGRTLWRVVTDETH